MATSLFKSKLTLGELYALEAELNGSKNPETQATLTKGLLAHKGISMKLRYYISSLSDVAVANKKKIDGLKDELITKLGEQTEAGTITLNTFVVQKDEAGKDILGENDQPVRVLNPKFIEFNEEMTKLTEEEVEISHYPFSIDDFTIDTDESYPVLFKLLKGQAEEVAEPAQ